MYKRGREDLAKIKEIVASAGTVNEVNATLREANRGAAQFLIADDRFTTIGTIWLAPKWKTRRTTFRAENGQTYDGFTLDANTVKFYTAGNGQVVAEIPVQNGDFVYITKFATSTTKPLVESAKLHNALQPLADSAYDGLVFPRSNPQTSILRDWVLGIRNKGRKGNFVQIDQAVSDVRIWFDEGNPAPITQPAKTNRPLVVDGPYLAWVYRPGLRYLLLAAWVSYDSWHKSASTASPGAFVPSPENSGAYYVIKDVSLVMKTMADGTTDYWVLIEGNNAPDLPHEVTIPLGVAHKVANALGADTPFKLRGTVVTHSTGVRAFDEEFAPEVPIP
jgi:hypothetical protein